MTVSLPLSKSELIAGKQAANVIVVGPGEVGPAQSAVKVSVFSINAAVYRNASVSGYLASPVHARVMPAADATGNSDAGAEVLIVISMKW